MQRKILSVLVALLMMETAHAQTPPPVAKQVPHVLEIHGRKLEDPYFWMRNKEDPDVKAYLEAENKYTEEAMKPTEAFQKQLYDECLARIKETDERPPYPKGDYVYFSRTEKGKQYPIY